MLREHADDAGMRLRPGVARGPAGPAAQRAEEHRRVGLSQLERVRRVAHTRRGQLLDTVHHAEAVGGRQDRPGRHHQVSRAEAQDMQRVQGEPVRFVQRSGRGAASE